MKKIERMGLVTAVVGLVLLTAAFCVGLSASHQPPHELVVAWLASGGS